MPDNKIILEPLTEATEKEDWIFKPEHKEILKAIKEGLNQKGTIKRGSFSEHLIAYDPIKELTDENFIGKAILECLVNNDPEGVMEVIGIYLNALEKTEFVQKSHVPKSTLYHSLKSKNPTIKTLAKLMHATTSESRKSSLK